MKQEIASKNDDRRTVKRKIGDLGENIACRFLVKQGFAILDRNYLKKCGEIDIVAVKDSVMHFVEVKTVSHLPVSHVTDQYRPEDNVHLCKLRRVHKTAQLYLNERGVSCETEWVTDVLVVYVDLNKNKQLVNFMPDIF